MSQAGAGAGTGSDSETAVPSAATNTIPQEHHDESKKRPSELAVEEEQHSNKRHESDTAVAEAKADDSEEKTEQSKSTGSNNNNNKKKESSSRDVDVTDAKPFGGRILTDESSVFEQNAWDHAPWGEEQEQHALKEIARQKLDPVPQELIEDYHANAAENWNKFYTKNENRFYKDRHYLRIEFPELFNMVEADVSIRVVLSTGGRS